MRALVGCLISLSISAYDNPVSAEEGTLTLGAALSMARSRAADVRAARARSAAADAEADVALAGYLPSASGAVGATQAWARRSNPEVPGVSPSFVDRESRRNLSANAEIRWTPFDFWQTPSLVGAARADARAAAYQANAVAVETNRIVASAYMTVVYDDLFVENAKLTTQIRERHAAIVRGMVTAGIRPTVEEARVRVELELSRLDVIAAERQAAQDRVKLATVLLLPPTTPLRVARPAALPAISEEPKLAAKQAVERRPEVFAANETVEARERSLTAAKAARLPALGTALQASHLSALADQDARFPSETALSAIVTLSVPIFDWRVWGQVPVARSNVVLAEAERDASVARVRGEAAEAAYGVQAARLLVEQSRATRELAGATLKVMEARYQAGLVTSTDLFDAAGQDANARRGVLRAELDSALALVQALAATNRISELER